MKIILKLWNAYFFDLLVASQVLQVNCYLTMTLVLISLWLFVIVSLTLLKYSQSLGINGAVGTLLIWIFLFFLLSHFSRCYSFDEQVEVFVLFVGISSQGYCMLSLFLLLLRSSVPLLFHLVHLLLHSSLTERVS